MKYMEGVIDVTMTKSGKYSFWERGLNENTNGLIHQYFQKNDFTTITKKDIHNNG